MDTCAGEFDAVTPYYYSSYGGENETVKSSHEKILVVGSGPIRIGQGIEFDYCCVQGVWALKELGYESIIINNNPETVSTDFDTADKLYFEPLHTDDVMNVIKQEHPEGVILQFGGQTSLNLASRLAARSIKILGTQNKYIDLAEDREKFANLLDLLDIDTPKGCAVRTREEAFEAVERLGYPLVVRPSFVIGGRAMQVVYSDEELVKYLKEAVKLSHEHPVLIDKYVEGKEIEVDAVADGEDVLIPGIMEHIAVSYTHLDVYKRQVLGIFTSDGDQNPTNTRKIIWCFIISLLAIGLLVTGGLESVQTVSLVVAFPFLFIMVGCCVSLVKSLRREADGDQR